MKAVSTRAFSVFYSYAHEDLALRDALDKHLATLRRNGWIQSWYDRDIYAGTDWKQEIDTHLHTADIILLLVSSDFLSSEYCYSIEMQEALRRHKAGEAVVIPIILRPVDWQGTPFSSLQVLPGEGRPVTSWSNRDEAFEQIAQGIRGVVMALRQVVFIISSPLDQSFVERLSQDLAARGVVLWDQAQVQLRDTLVQGEAIHHTIRTAFAVLLIASPHAPYSHIVEEHLELATLLNKPVLVVWATGDDWDKSVPKGWRKKDAIDAREERYEAALTELVVRLRSRVSLSPFIIPSSGTQEVLFEPRNPYKGLRAFSYNDTRDFFGRATLIGELADVLEASLNLEQRGNQDSRLLTVIGPSGSGKSSVMMAGLLPYLQSGKVLNSDEWVYLDPVLPGGHPLEALAVTLAKKLPERSVLSLQKDLESDSVRVLHLLASQVTRRPEAKVVLLVDQFEELFTLTISEEERQHFIDLLVTAVAEPHGPVILILTLRADFYDRPMSYPSLSRIIRQHLVHVLPMEIRDLRDVIEQPALLPEVGLTFEGDLISDLLFEVRGQVGALPLLEFILEQLFQRCNGRLLTLRAYRELGGVKGALSRQTEKTYAALPSEEHRRLARSLFVRLIDPGMTEQDTTRRRAALAEFTLDDPTQTRIMRETIDTFIAARLLTTNEITGTTTIEVSHEAVIREWPRLAGWLREARDDIRLQQAISEDATEWERLGKPGDRLYRGSQLREAQAWAKRDTPSGTEVAFLRAGAASRVRSLISVISLLLIVASSMGVASWVLTHQLVKPPAPTRVSNLQDNNRPGSLRYAVNDAPSGSTITFNANLRGTIRLTSGDLNIAKDLMIRGPGAGNVAISNDSRGFVVYINTRVSVSIFDLAFKDSTLRLRSTGPSFNSFINNRGALSLTNSVISSNRVSVDNGDLLCAGGIYNTGALTLTNTIVSNNSVSGGSTESLCVGGILSLDRLILTNSTVSDNKASGDNSKFICSGGIYDEGTFALSNSTVSGNRATGGMCSGGIYKFQGTLVLTNSTVSGNSVSGRNGNGGGIAISDHDASGTVAPVQVTLLYCTVYGNTANVGGGIWIDTLDKKSQVTMGASIVAGNNAHTGPDIAGRLTTLGYDLVEDRSGATFLGLPKVQSTDVLGVSSTDLKIDPVLRDNGGSARPHTWTHRLLPGSPAIDRIPPVTCHANTISTDQRGIQRPQGRGCDIGAYEYGPTT
jgi:TIR domain